MLCKIKYEITEKIDFECFWYPLNYVTILRGKRGWGTSWLGTILTYIIWWQRNSIIELTKNAVSEILNNKYPKKTFLNCAFIQTSKKFKSGKCNYDRVSICILS